MKEIIDTIRIESNPDTIWDALVSFLHSTENYKLWHKDHVSIRWKKGEPFSPGSILIAKEKINNRTYTIAFRIEKIDRENFLIEYTVLFPFSVVCSSGYFRLTSHGTTTDFTAQLELKIGTFAQRLFKKDIESLRKHMQEEGENINRLIDTSPSATGKE